MIILSYSLEKKTTIQTSFLFPRVLSYSHYIRFLFFFFLLLFFHFVVTSIHLFMHAHEKLLNSKLFFSLPLLLFPIVGMLHMLKANTLTCVHLLLRWIWMEWNLIAYKQHEYVLERWKMRCNELSAYLSRQINVCRRQEAYCWLSWLKDFKDSVSWYLTYFHCLKMTHWDLMSFV